MFETVGGENPSGYSVRYPACVVLLITVILPNTACAIVGIVIPSHVSHAGVAIEVPPTIGVLILSQCPSPSLVSRMRNGRTSGLNSRPCPLASTGSLL